MKIDKKLSLFDVIIIVAVVVIIITVPSLFKDLLNKRSVEQKQGLNLYPRKPIDQFRTTELTFETLKQYKGFENTSEADAAKQIDVIKRMAKILHHLYLNEQHIENKKN